MEGKYFGKIVLDTFWVILLINDLYINVNILYRGHMMCFSIFSCKEGNECNKGVFSPGK